MWDGTTPLTGGTNPSADALNPPFWARVDYLLTTAASYGITIGPILWNSNNSSTLAGSWTSTQWTGVGQQDRHPVRQHPEPDLDARQRRLADRAGQHLGRDPHRADRRR